jgi:hypothetical protein
VKIYHFSSTLPETGGTVDPRKLGANSWSTAEKRALSIPRSFFYTHPKHREALFTKDSPLFSTDVPDDKVYDFDKDEHGIKQPGTTLSHMIAKVLRKGYHGVKYFDGKVVAMFKPVKVTPAKIKLAREDVVAHGREYHEKHKAQFGLDRDFDSPGPTWNPELSKRTAAAFEKAKHLPDHPKVRAAYDQLAKEIEAQHAFLVSKGVRFTPWTKEGQPYANSKEMQADVHNNGHLHYFPSDRGQGQGEVSKPSLSPEVNDKFRAVHDYFGHAMNGHQFGPKGELQAWGDHAKMFSPLARAALTTETHGQNSWVNFGPESHRPVTERPYAPQKATLLPKNVIPLSRFGVPPVVDVRRPGNAKHVYAWVTPTGEVHHVPHSMGHIDVARKHGFKDTTHAQQNGWLRVSSAGATLDGGNFVVPPNAKQIRALKDLAIAAQYDSASVNDRALRLSRSLVYVSPSMREGSTMTQALASFKSPEHAALNSEAQRLGGDPVPAMGTWTDGAEESSVIKVPSGRAKVVAALLGKKFQQKAVGLFTPGAGSDTLHLVYLRGHTPESADAKLRAHGIEYATHIPVKNGVITHLIGAPDSTVAAWEVPFRKVTGTAEFPGADTREAAAKVYDEMLTMARQLPEPTGDIRTTPTQHIATFDSGGNQYTARMVPFYTGSPHHVFDFKQHDTPDEYGITGAGNAMETFSHVAAHFIHGLRTLKPKRVYFSAEEPSRIKLYESLMKRLPKYAPEYTAKPSSVRGEWFVEPREEPEVQLARGDWTPLSENVPRFPKQKPDPKYTRTIQVPIGRLKMTETGQHEPTVDEYEKEFTHAPEQFPAIVVDRGMNIQDGHHRYKAALKNGQTHVPIRIQLQRETMVHGWMSPEGDFHANDEGHNHETTASRLVGLPINPANNDNTDALYDQEYMHVSTADGTLQGHSSKRKYTAPQLKAFRDMAVKSGLRAAITTTQNGRPWNRELKLARPAPFSEATKALLPQAGDPNARGVLADHLEELGDPLHHVFRGAEAPYAHTKGKQVFTGRTNGMYFSLYRIPGDPKTIAASVNHTSDGLLDGWHHTQVPLEAAKGIIRHHFGNVVHKDTTATAREMRTSVGPDYPSYKKAKANQAREVMKLARGDDSVHPAEGWIEEDGTHHANEDGEYMFRHLQTVRRLGYKNKKEAEAAGLMHVAADDGQLLGHRDDQKYTGPQLITLKKLARLHKTEPAITTTSNGVVTTRTLKLARPQNPSYAEKVLWPQIRDEGARGVLADHLEELGDPLHHVLRAPVTVDESRYNNWDSKLFGHIKDRGISLTMWPHREPGKVNARIFTAGGQHAHHTVVPLDVAKEVVKYHHGNIVKNYPPVREYTSREDYDAVPTEKEFRTSEARRFLKMARSKAPSGGMIVNNQFYQGGKFLPRVFQSIKRVRDAKRAMGAKVALARIQLPEGAFKLKSLSDAQIRQIEDHHGLFDDERLPRTILPDGSVEAKIEHVAPFFDKLTKKAIGPEKHRQILADPGTSDDVKFYHLLTHSHDSAKDYLDAVKTSGAEWYGSSVAQLDKGLAHFFGREEPGNPSSPVNAKKWTPHHNKLFKLLLALTSYNTSPVPNTKNAAHALLAGYRHHPDKPFENIPDANYEALAPYKDLPKPGVTVEERLAWEQQYGHKEPGYMSAPVRLSPDGRVVGVVTVSDGVKWTKPGYTMATTKNGKLPLTDEEGNLRPKSWGSMPPDRVRKFKEFLHKAGGDYKKASKLLSATFTPQQLKALFGLKSVDRGDLDPDEKIPGSYAFGPKFGAFYQNLTGDKSRVTQDKWFTRTMTRLVSNLYPGGKISEVPDTPVARRLYKRVSEAAAKKLGLDPADFQAVLWYYEQNLWRLFGAKNKSEDFSHGIRKLLVDKGFGDKVLNKKAKVTRGKA